MLQLVVEIHNTEAMILLVTSPIRVPNPNDKLKHVGHVGLYAYLYAQTFSERLRKRPLNQDCRAIPMLKRAA